MSQWKAIVTRVATNGPYAYVLLKNGVGQKDSNSLANVSAALDGIKADIGAGLNGETVNGIIITAISAP